MRIVSVEAVAEKWLVPRLATFKADHPGIAIEVETNHRGVDPDRRDFDAWFAYTGETVAPRPVTRRQDILLEETLYEEELLPAPYDKSPRPSPSGGEAKGSSPDRVDSGTRVCRGALLIEIDRLQGRLAQQLWQFIGGAVSQVDLTQHVVGDLQDRIHPVTFMRGNVPRKQCCACDGGDEEERPSPAG